MNPNVYMAPNEMIPDIGSAFSSQRGQQQPAPYGIPQFYIEVKSVGGKAVNREMVRVLTPGDPKSMPVHKVTDEIRRKYAPWYDRWRQQLDTQVAGTPLEAWPAMTPELIHQLKSKNVFTVEQMVDVPDSSLHEFPMGRTLRNQAKTFLEVQAKSVSAAEIEGERAAHKAELDVLNGQLEALNKRLDELTKKD